MWIFELLVWIKKDSKKSQVDLKRVVKIIVACRGGGQRKWTAPREKKTSILFVIRKHFTFYSDIQGAYSQYQVTQTFTHKYWRYMNTSRFPKNHPKKIEAGKLNPKIPPQSIIRSEWVLLKIILLLINWGCKLRYGFGKKIPSLLLHRITNVHKQGVSENEWQEKGSSRLSRTDIFPTNTCIRKMLMLKQSQRLPLMGLKTNHASQQLFLLITQIFIYPPVVLIDYSQFYHKCSKKKLSTT